MSPDEVRLAFRDFCGPAQARKFARSLVKTCDADATFDRLRYWQEILWAKFLVEFPEAPSSVDVIGSCLHWCDVHNQSLIKGSGHQQADLRRADSFELARENEFPFGFGWLVYHCPECNSACIGWIAAHPTECRMLQHRVYDAERVKEHRANQTFLTTLRDAFIPVDEIQDGDEIWTINTGRGADSLALVRDGTIIYLVD